MIFKAYTILENFKNRVDIIYKRLIEKDQNNYVPIEIVKNLEIDNFIYVHNLTKENIFYKNNFFNKNINIDNPIDWDPHDVIEIRFNKFINLISITS